MGENLKPRWRFLGLAGSGLLVSLLALGCASTGPSQPAAAADGLGVSEIESREATPRTIQAMKLEDGFPATRLEVMSDQSLVWTSYRDSDGNLVIELPNSVPSSGLSRLSREDGLVVAVDVELDEGGSRPLTRLMVRTRQDADHTLSADGNSLLLELVPVAGTGVTVAEISPPAEDPEPTGESLLPLPDEPEAPRTTEALMETTPAVAGKVAPGEDELAIRYSDHEITHPATILESVTILSTPDGTVLKIAGDGQFSYSSFRLESPNRFVVDLAGVINASSRSTVPVASDAVDRVRIAQFRPFPEPISRVVFDLPENGEPTLTPLEDGLLVRFSTGEPSAAAVAESRPQAQPEMPAPSIEEAREADLEASVAKAWAEEEGSAPQEPSVAFEETPVEAEPVVIAQEVPEQAVVEAYEEPVEVAQSEPVMEESASQSYDDYAGAEPLEVVEVTPEVAEVEERYEEPTPAMPEPVDVPSPEPYEVITEAVPEPEELEPVVIAEESEMPSAGAPEPMEESSPPVTDVALFEAAQIQYEEVRQRAEPLATEIESDVVGRGGRVFSGEPITMSLKDADIKDVLRSFSGITGLNVVVHPGVRGSVTVELKEVPWDQALDLILKINNLDFVLEGNIMRIASTAQLEGEAQARRRLAAARAQEVPLTTMIRSVSYANAAQIARLLTTSAGSGGGGRGGSRGGRRSSILSNRGSVTVDARTNKIIIKELPGNMSTVLAIIDNLDTAEPQVLIEARIVETTKSFSRTLGINWAFNAVADDQFGNTTGLQFPHRGSANGGVNLLTGGNNGFLDISLGNILDTFTLDANLQAAENEGLVTILSEPKIATLNNQQASIQSGLQIPIQTVANNTVTVQFVNATLSLEVTPQVTTDGTVLMDIDIAKREPQLAFAIAGAANAPISTKQARTRVIVRDGGTTVIGGIYEVSNNRGEDRVPGLASIPILGHLFKNKRRNNDNEELLIFITPRVIQL